MTKSKKPKVKNIKVYYDKDAESIVLQTPKPRYQPKDEIKINKLPKGMKFSKEDCETRKQIGFEAMDKLIKKNEITKEEAKKLKTEIEAFYDLHFGFKNSENTVATLGEMQFKNEVDTFEQSLNKFKTQTELLKNKFDELCKKSITKEQIKKDLVAWTVENDISLFKIDNELVQQKHEIEALGIKFDVQVKKTIQNNKKIEKLIDNCVNARKNGKKSVFDLIKIHNITDKDLGPEEMNKIYHEYLNNIKQGLGNEVNINMCYKTTFVSKLQPQHLKLKQNYKDLSKNIKDYLASPDSLNEGKVLLVGDLKI